MNYQWCWQFFIIHVTKSISYYEILQLKLFFSTLSNFKSKMTIIDTLTITGSFILLDVIILFCKTEILQEILLLTFKGVNKILCRNFDRGLVGPWKVCPISSRNLPWKNSHGPVGSVTLLSRWAILDFLVGV